MTLSDRNLCLKTGIFATFVFLVLTAVSVFFIIPAVPAASAGATHRPSGILAAFIGRFTVPGPYAPIAAIGGSVFYAFIAAVLIYRYFEKTQSPEILFIAFFVFSFAVEGMRVVVPISRIIVLPGFYLLMASRLLLFGRYFGIFSLFAASVCAAGFEVQKQRNILFVTALATLVIALGVPVNTLTWDSTFSMISGYTHMFRMVESGVFIITIASFLISAYSRGSGEFVFIGLGIFLAFAGRLLLQGADSWPGLAGLPVLAAGTWIICVRLHRVYLWM
ncbi:MAG: hypothetical protein LBI86_06920 [Treponema sp.]|jgi:hypothetical protein|nr:hypothetical protein [Treponema sp.]